jgi:hypothetical protein
VKAPCFGLKASGKANTSMRHLCTRILSHIFFIGDASFSFSAEKEKVVSKKTRVTSSQKERKKRGEGSERVSFFEPEVWNLWATNRSSTTCEQPIKAAAVVA